MNITVAQLIGAGIAPTQAKAFVDALNQVLPLFNINTAPRIAAFIAQCAHESTNFTALEESLYYRTPERIRAMWPTRVPNLALAATLCRNPVVLANKVYSDRLGNGNEASGDGWKYRGRGLLQITGRGNYREAGFEAIPEDVAKPYGAVMTACKFWSRNNLNALADSSNIDAVTRVINGPAMVGKVERRENFREALAAMSTAGVAA